MGVHNPVSTVNDPINNNKMELQPLLANHTAPIATTEMDDDLDDDREVVTKPYPGIDDGFFDGKNKPDVPEVERINPNRPKINIPSLEPDVPEVERIDPNKPKLDIPDIEFTPATPEFPDMIPTIFTRMGGDDDDDRKQPDAIDGVAHDDNVPLGPFGPPGSMGPLSPPTKAHFPGFDIEGGSTFGDIPDVNIYQHKKTLAQGMMDLALFSANANQLRYVVESRQHPYFYPSVILISFSLIVQVAVGIGLIWNATYNVKNDKEIRKANKINNFTVIGIFLVTVVNVFISAFGVASPAAGVTAPTVVVNSPVVNTGQ